MYFPRMNLFIFSFYEKARVEFSWGFFYYPFAVCLSFWLKKKKKKCNYEDEEGAERKREKFLLIKSNKKCNWYEW